MKVFSKLLCQTGNQYLTTTGRSLIIELDFLQALLMLKLIKVVLSKEAKSSHPCLATGGSHENYPCSVDVAQACA
jgi:hypothetical protein